MISRSRSASLGVKPARVGLVAAAAAAHGTEKRLGVLVVEREQEKLLLARGEAFRVLAQLVEAPRAVVHDRHAVAQKLDRSPHGRVDLARWRSVAPLHQVAQLVDDEAPALGGEDVQERLGAEHLADRGRERRPAALAPDRRQLVEHLVQPVGGRVLAEPCVELRDEAGGKAVLRGAHGHARRERRHRLVAERLVHELRPAPEHVEVDPRVVPEAGERLRQRLRRDAMERERDRVERARDALRAGAHRLDRSCERDAAGALAVEPDRQPAGLLHALDELAGLGRMERTGRVVDEDARSAEVGQVVRPLQQHLRLAGRPGAVDEADGELLAGVADRVGGLAEVREVVEGVVDAEHVDAARRRAGHEAADEVARDRARAHEEPAAKRHAQRGRAARADGADALPGALDAAAHGAVEAAAAGDLQTGEARLVELGRELVEARRGDALGERLLGEEPDRRVDEVRH